jgi:hypothetical protein
MYINNISVNTRHNRPTVTSKTALIAYFFNDGQYVDPDAISAVTIFKSSENWYPSSVIGSDGQIKSSASSLVLMNYSNSSSDISDSSFDPNNYVPGQTASGIYRLKEGVYAVILDYNNVPSGVFNLSGSVEIPNKVNLAQEYIDVWTLRPLAGTDLITVINNFELNYDRFFTTTEPLLFRVSTRLANRNIVLGSKVDLKFTNEFTIENNNIDSSIINLFKQSLVMNPAIEIYKENSDRNLPSRVTVSSFAQTSGLCEVTSDNTIIYNFDTEALKTHPELVNGNLGPLTGAYVAKVKFDVLNQTFYSNNFGIIVS